MKFFWKVLILSPIFITIILFLLTAYQKPSSNIATNNSDVSSIIHQSEFILMGDTGTGSKEQYKVAGAIKNHCATKNCKALFILGDVIYDHGVESVSDEQFKTKFEDPYRNISLPFYIVYGNHDYLGCTDCYIKYSMVSKKWKMPERYYLTEFDDISFYAVDTENLNSEQIKWLVEKLSADTNAWKIVIGHRPLMTYEKTKIDEGWSGKSQLKDAICNYANFYISGHSHVLEIPGKIDGCKVEQFISGGGGAGLREVNKPYRGKFFAEENGFLVLSLFDTDLKISFFNENTELLFSQ